MDVRIVLIALYSACPRHPLMLFERKRRGPWWGRGRGRCSCRGDPFTLRICTSSSLFSLLFLPTDRTSHTSSSLHCSPSKDTGLSSPRSPLFQVCTPSVSSRTLLHKQQCNTSRMVHFKTRILSLAALLLTLTTTPSLVHAKYECDTSLGNFYPYCINIPDHASNGNRLPTILMLSGSGARGPASQVRMLVGARLLFLLFSCPVLYLPACSLPR